MQNRIKRQSTTQSLRLLCILSIGLALSVLPMISFAGSKSVLSISPIHMLFPIVEMTLERSVASNMSVAGILGYGSISVPGDRNDDVKFTIFEAGAQYRYYPEGDVKSGWQLGVETQYLKPKSKTDSSGTTIKANGFALGPFVGYKWDASSGIIYDVQIGYQRLFSQAKAKDNLGNEIDSSVTNGLTFVNFNVGFGF